MRLKSSTGRIRLSRMANDHVSLYLLSGLATAPNFMDHFRLALHRMVEEKAASVHSELLFPYGDWSRRTIPQLREIGHDMRLGVSRYERSIGGKRAIEAMESKRTLNAGRRQTIWIGHSGGGIAAVHAAGILAEREGEAQCPVVLIGSPKCRIQQELRGSVLYVYAVGDSLPSKRSFWFFRQNSRPDLPSWNVWRLGSEPAWASFLANG